MLKTSKLVTLNGQSLIDGKAAEGYQASINTENPDDMTITSWQIDKALYKANKAICRADRADFEDMAYEIQGEIVPQNGEEVSADE